MDNKIFANSKRVGRRQEKVKNLQFTFKSATMHHEIEYLEVNKT